MDTRQTFPISRRRWNCTSHPPKPEALWLTLIRLSKQLYQESTHFLLELIQNTDDNSYTRAQNPTLSVSYRNRRLLFTCNEDGFSKSNVDAICKIGRSTKTARDSATQYIGEKGIGFKSVFKIADVVWIKSGHYSFSLDKRDRLGMIAPVWTPFPGKAPEGVTAILLQLSPDFDEDELLDEIRNFDSSALVFLQKLQRLELSFVSSVSGAPFRSTIVKRARPAALDGHFGLAEIQHDSLSQRYLTMRHQVVDGLPAEPNRPGCRSTEIQLAFPVLQAGSTQIKSQNVYAFLPIRDYGFKVRDSSHLVTLKY